MERNRTAVIGLGEAGLAFATGQDAAAGYDRLFDGAGGEATKAAAQAAGIRIAGSNEEAVAGAAVILSTVTADQALAAARETARAIAAGALFCDMNSVAPQTKRAAATVIEAAGGRYVDVAVMAPVLPLGRRAPLLVAGPHAVTAAEALGARGFGDVRAIEGSIGAASAIKMIRSVMVKGIEALSAECATAAAAAGVLDQVVASLDSSWPGDGWAGRLDYNLDRMMVHGLRRAAEMKEAAATLAGLGVDPAMTRGTIGRQRAMGALRIAPPVGLAAKLAALGPSTTDFREVAAS